MRRSIHAHLLGTQTERAKVMSEKKTKDEEAILALAHALADQRWIAEDRLDDVNSLQEDNDNLRAQNGELNDTIARQREEIERLNEDCARRAKDLTTFDQMRAQAIRERDEARSKLEAPGGAILEAEITADQRALIHQIGLHWVKDYNVSDREHWEVAVRIWAFNKNIIWSKES